MGSGSSKYEGPPEIQDKYYPGFVEGLPNLAGKNFAITGCTSGTGYETALAAARKGAKVFMLNRVSARSEAAEKAIKLAVPNADIRTVACDLTSLASTREASAVLVKELKDTGLDVLCCNAGVMANKDEATGDGYDIQMQTNHIGHFLLVGECLSLLNKAADLRNEARVVNHSSLARTQPSKLEKQYFGKNGGSLGGDGASMFCGGARWVRYGQTKLANAVFTNELQRRFEKAGSKVKAMCAAPGLGATNLQVTTAADGGFGDAWIMRWAQSPADASMSLTTCCFSPNVKGGEFWEPTDTGNLRGPPGISPGKNSETNAESGAMLWVESEAATGVKYLN